MPFDIQNLLINQYNQSLSLDLGISIIAIVDEAIIHLINDLMN